MHQTLKKIISVANDLEKSGLNRTAGIIDEIGNNILQIKTAQYLGIQGYWIRNRRCWDRCYRVKRAQYPTTPTQKIWTECHKEYINALNDEGWEWAKYADKLPDNIKKFANKDSKLSKQIINADRNFFHKTVAQKASEGISIDKAIIDTINEGIERYALAYVDESNKLMLIAQKLRDKGYEEIANKIADAVQEMTKEAQFGRRLKNWFTGGADKEDNEFLKSAINNLLSAASNLVSTSSKLYSQNRDDKETFLLELNQSGVYSKFNQALANINQSLNELKMKNISQAMDDRVNDVVKAINDWVQQDWSKRKTTGAVSRLSHYLADVVRQPTQQPQQAQPVAQEPVAPAEAEPQNLVERLRNVPRPDSLKKFINQETVEDAPQNNIVEQIKNIKNYDDRQNAALSAIKSFITDLLPVLGRRSRLDRIIDFINKAKTAESEEELKIQ